MTLQQPGCAYRRGADSIACNAAHDPTFQPGFALTAVSEGVQVDRYAGFSDFVQAREGALLRTAFLLTTDVQLAEDLLQSALAKAALHWPRIRDGQPEAYIRSALYRESVSRWRHRRGVSELPTASMPERGDASREDEMDLRFAVIAALRRLAPRQRAVLVLRFYEDFSEGQAAEALGCSVGTVKSQTHDALRRLRAVAPELGEFMTNPGVLL
jgi:RNA polymerase sigma-70 factor (sigma-E family)